MTIIVTAGASNSNSYITLSEANSYFSTGFFNTNWTGLASDTIRENWIVEAARAIDRFNFQGSRWKGNAQALAFPRTNFDDFRYNNDLFREFPEDDLETPQGEIPVKVKEAQYLMIQYLYTNQDNTTGTIESREIKKVSALKGLANVEYEQDRQSRDIRRYTSVSLDAIKNLLSPWMSGVNNIPYLR